MQTTEDVIVDEGVRKILRFVPPSEKIVVKRIEQEKLGSLYIPQSAASRSTVGIVVSVPDVLLTIDLEVGDKVIFGYNNGVNIDIRFGTKQFKYVGLHEKELVCKVSEETLDAWSEEEETEDA